MSINEANVKLFGDAILIRIEKNEMKTKSGIIIPTNTKDNGLARGTIVAMGSGKLTNGNEIDMSQFTVGDDVLFPDWAGTSIPTSTLESAKLVIVKAEDIKLAIMEGK